MNSAALLADAAHSFGGKVLIVSQKRKKKDFHIEYFPRILRYYDM